MARDERTILHKGADGPGIEDALERLVRALARQAARDAVARQLVNKDEDHGRTES